MQDKPNNKEHHFLKLNSARKINLPLSPSLNKDPFPSALILMLNFKVLQHRFILTPYFKNFRKTSVSPCIIAPNSTIKHGRIGNIKQTKGYFFGFLPYTRYERPGP